MAVETAAQSATETAPAEIEIEMQEFLSSRQQLQEFIDEDEETVIITDRRTSTPEQITSPRQRTSIFA